MITRFITSVSTTFSPFNARSGKTARNFLALLPPNARSTMKINVKMLPREQATVPGTLELAFKDGKQLKFDLEQSKIGDVTTEADRHSRGLARHEALTG